MFFRAQDLADANFLCPFGGPGRGEVHKVYAGDEQHEDGDAAQDIKRGGIADIRHFVIEVGMQRNSLQVETAI